jgi:hypothetical protein
LTKINLECPVCENQFGIASEQVAKKVIACPLCNKNFDILANRIQKQSQPKVAKPIQRPSTAPDSAAQPRSTSPTPAAPIADAKPAASANDPFAVTRATKARAIGKRKKKSTVVPVILGLAALASGIAMIAFFIIYDPLKKPDPKLDEVALLDEEAVEQNETDDPAAKPENKDSANSEANKNEAGEKGSVFRTDGESDEVELPPTNSPPDKPPKTPSYRIIRKADVQKFWENQFWHFVRLRVDTGESSHYVSGTIVDSRGWVATSLSAVANAKEIEIQSADSNLKEFNGVRLQPTDLVRGVIKTDPESDLVLLSINREFVLSPSGVTFGKSDSLVSSQNVIQCACPGSDNWAWPREAQLEGLKSYEDMDFDFQTQIEERKLDQKQRFIVHSGYTDTAHGAALFAPSGELLGINTGISDESSMMIAAPVEKLMEMISASEDRPMSLSSLTR